MPFDVLPVAALRNSFVTMFIRHIGKQPMPLTSVHVHRGFRQSFTKRDRLIFLTKYHILMIEMP